MRTDQYQTIPRSMVIGPFASLFLLVIVFALVGLCAGCEAEPTSVALTAQDCAPVDVRCYR